MQISKKIMLLPLLLCAIASANTSFGEWIVVVDKSASDLILTADDMLNFNASGTFTVDENTSADRFNVNATNALVVINSGQTLSLKGLLNEVTNRTVEQTFNVSGDGSMVISGTQLRFLKQDSGAQQNFNINVGTFSLASKTLVVQGGNAVSLGSVKLSSANISMSGNSSLSATIADASTPGITLNMSDSSTLSIKRSVGLRLNNSTLGDGTTLLNTNAAVGGTLANLNLAIDNSLTIGKVVKAELGGNVYLSAATLTVNANSGTVYAKQINLQGDSIVNLNTKNAFYGDGGQTQGNSLIFSISGANKQSTINLGADQDILRVSISTGAILLINSNGHKLNLSQATFATADNKILIDDFAENSIYVGTSLAKNADESLVNVFALIDDVQTALYQLENGYLSRSSIPEPATVAAIFGALALGLVVIRRSRK